MNFGLTFSETFMDATVTKLGIEHDKGRCGPKFVFVLKTINNYQIIINIYFKHCKDFLVPIELQMDIKKTSFNVFSIDVLNITTVYSTTFTK